MANGKKKTPEKAASVPVVFSKAKVLTLKRYAKRRDLLKSLLTDGEYYTMDQVDAVIQKFMKGKVK